MDWNSERELLINAGVDVDTVVGRFMGNEKLAVKFIRKFGEDETFRKLGECIEAGDCQEAFAMVHTLKGVAGNLGMTQLYEQAIDLTERLRTGKMDGADRSYEEMKVVYDRILEAVASI